MRESTFVALDEYLPAGTNGASNAIFTGAQFNVQLAKYNSLSVHAVFDNITTPGTGGPFYLYGFCEESNDGRSWMQRSNPVGSFAQADADLAIKIVSGATGPLQAIWSDAAYGVSRNLDSTTLYSATGPLLGFVRFRIFFDNAGVAGHLRLSVCQRDR